MNGKLQHVGLKVVAHGGIGAAGMRNGHEFILIAEDHASLKEMMMAPCGS